MGDREQAEITRKMSAEVLLRGGSTRENNKPEGGGEKPHPTGVKVSIPLAADQGRPFDFATSWTFLAVISTARAG